MLSTLVFLGALVFTMCAGLFANRVKLEARAGSLARGLLREGAEGVFEPSMLEGVPEPARRYLARSIAPGTPLARSVRLRLDGSIRLSAEGPPARMASEEVLAPARGYVWRARVRSGYLPIRGYDLYAGGSGEMRWWLAGIFPVVRVSDDDFDRSAIGRFVGEAVFAPAMLLPETGASWEAVDADRARVRRTVDGEEVESTLRTDAQGRLVEVEVLRWNADEQNGPVGYLPFVVRCSGRERTFDGFTLPSGVEAGWRAESGGVEPFFAAEIVEAHFGT